MLNYIAMKKPIFSFLLRVSISFIFIIILLYIMRGKYGQILSVLEGTNVFLFILAFFLYILAISVASLRMKLIVVAQEIPLKFSEAISLTFIGYFFNNFLPTAIGGDVVKGYYLSKKTTYKLGAYTSIFMDYDGGKIRNAKSVGRKSLPIPESWRRREIMDSNRDATTR